MPYKAFEIAGIGTVTIYKRRGSRSIRLTVAPDGSVRVTMPYWAPYQAGAAFAQSRTAWIAKQPRPTTDVLPDGMPVGKAHHLHFRADPLAERVKTSVRNTEVIVSHHPSLAPDDVAVQGAARTACYRALRNQATQLLGQRLAQLAAYHDVSYRSFAIKRMTSRWGSCDQYHNIVLNLYLVQLPWDLIDYVILHELSHITVLHHGPDFWQRLEALLPHARTYRKRMRTYRPTLLIAEPAAAVA
ncbi:MAG TPA: SprT family zinc-dependent metalloprotease [Candidatus Saccharimonadales bacterium]|nr:SprT family zinc-dependent metalloprotease [Candidatus Saccharimonadales bacterium]